MWVVFKTSWFNRWNRRHHVCAVRNADGSKQDSTYYFVPCFLPSTLSVCRIISTCMWTVRPMPMEIREKEPTSQIWLNFKILSSPIIYFAHMTVLKSVHFDLRISIGWKLISSQLFHYSTYCHYDADESQSQIKIEYQLMRLTKSAVWVGFTSKIVNSINNLNQK